MTVPFNPGLFKRIAAVHFADSFWFRITVDHWTDPSAVAGFAVQNYWGYNGDLAMPTNNPDGPGSPSATQGLYGATTLIRKTPVGGTDRYRDGIVVAAFGTPGILVEVGDDNDGKAFFAKVVFSYDFGLAGHRLHVRPAGGADVIYTPAVTSTSFAGLGDYPDAVSVAITGDAGVTLPDLSVGDIYDFVFDNSDRVT